MSDLPSLISEFGEPFSEEELTEWRAGLEKASNPDRLGFRDKNASAIATLDAPRLLIVAGPGTGKSFLFMERIRSWAARYPGKPIYVSSFVRKLVR
ncbi:MAG TPA: hypothetical protein VGQ42_12115 [Candidatus Dormibacteraeota bacterium]|jgi:predicted NACHT family NTPase|nr:hypothetical protein [Candidatus Dormibacteraeota bacterium]